MKLNRHGTDDQLEFYILGRLHVSEQAELEEHLIVCAACRGRLDTLDHYLAGMKEALATEVAPAPVQKVSAWFEWLCRQAVPLAVAVVAVIGILSIMSTGRAKVEPVSLLTLTATRGEMPTAARAGEVELRLADSPTDGTVFRIEVLNVAGQTVWSGLAQSTSSGVQVKTQRKLQPGDYLVRLHAISGEVLREYGFRIRQ